MKYYRYMSKEEFNAMLDGKEIVGKQSFNARTSSKGICFLGEDTVFTSLDYDYDTMEEVAREIHFRPTDCYKFLEGIVSDYVLVEFETTETLTESEGVYSDPINLDWNARIIITEYCIHKYTREIMRPIRFTYGNPDAYNTFSRDSVWYPVWYPIS